MSQNYILQVTTGTGYDITKHQIVPVNTATPVKVESDLISAEVNVRIQDYRGLPHSSPPTAPYFSTSPHDKNKDQYSIAFRFVLPPGKSINGNDLVFGNDFDHPIRDRLPPGFATAFRIVKWVVDPGLDGDVYAEKPYLYGPAASSVNTLFVGDVVGEKGVRKEEGEKGIMVEEGGSESGMEVRHENGVPDSDGARKKYFLTEENRKEFEFEAGREYACDFFNPYLDFNEFALRLPGFTLPIMRYWDGQGLRYTLKNRATDEVLMVVLFTLYLKEDVDDEGRVMDGVEAGKPFDLLPTELKEKHNAMKTGHATSEEHHHLDIEGIEEGVEKIKMQQQQQQEMGGEKPKGRENEKPVAVPVQDTSADDVD